MSPSSRSLDVAIAGGGVVGLTTATLLAESGFRVHLFDPNPAPQMPAEGYDVRQYALSPASRNVLLRVGAWDGVDHSRVATVEGMAVWDACSVGAIDFGRNSPSANLAFMVEHANLVTALRERAVVLGVTLEVDTIDSATQVQDGIMLSLASGRSSLARLLVAADGRRSGVAGSLGIQTTRQPYGQRALVANIVCETEHGNVARQRFLPTGPLAVLPLPEPRFSSIVWSCRDEYADELLGMSEDRFAAALSSAFEYKLGTLRPVSPVSSFELERAQASQWCGRNWVLVGDAAHTIHPLAGHGLNLGIMDAASMHELITAGDNREIPGMSTLRRYERWRKSEAFKFDQLIHSLHHVFASERRALTTLRGTGMQLIDRCTVLNRWFVTQALGVGREAPATARASK